MRKFLMIIMLTLALPLLLAACNTVSGIGRDISGASETVKQHL